MAVTCGLLGQAQSTAPKPAVTKNGEVTLTLLNVQGAQAVTVLGRFSSGDVPLPAEADDSCNVTPLVYSELGTGVPAESPAQSTPVNPQPAPTALNAGPFIYLQSDQGVYLSAVRRADFYRSVSRGLDAPAFLQAIGAAPGPLPTPLTLVVPGGGAGEDRFPPLQLKIPHLPPFELTSPPVLSSMSPDAELVWSGASLSKRASVMIALNQLGPERGLRIFCRAKDDGRFSFPEAVRREMSAPDLRGGVLSGQIVRVMTISKVQGEARLVVYLVEGQFDLNR
ncbi:hypothetical protein DKM44_14805 [Deinococcus irradiatisoli]|uniref:Uncharacterized protein n=1 Tax=Deinococcus irradiatisoli TaxID=2202254 RepID=A0A2Z3JNI2_9DEIO|nr:hypothetical protein DKM44_14805 [Deinococcus irradiatisoli]